MTTGIKSIGRAFTKEVPRALQLTPGDVGYFLRLEMIRAGTELKRAISRPEPMPAKNKSGMDVVVRNPYIMRNKLGGMIKPSWPQQSTNPEQKGLS